MVISSGVIGCDTALVFHNLFRLEDTVEDSSGSCRSSLLMEMVLILGILQ